MDNDELDDEQAQESQELIPTEQDTIIFNGKPLVVVRLPDGKPGVVLRWICENLHIGQKAQVERIKRTEVIAGDLVYVQVQTGGGFQTMPTLVLDSVPYWLATIDTRRMEKDDPKRPAIKIFLNPSGEKSSTGLEPKWNEHTKSYMSKLRSDLYSTTQGNHNKKTIPFRGPIDCLGPMTCICRLHEPTTHSD